MASKFLLCISDISEKLLQNAVEWHLFQLHWMLRCLADAAPGRRRLADMASCRRRLIDGLDRQRLADGAWQMASGRHGIWQTRRLAVSVCHTATARRRLPRLSGRRCLPDGLGRRRLADSVWQTACQTRHLADMASCRCRLIDGHGRRQMAPGRHGVWQMRCLADAAFGSQCLPDSDCQTPSAKAVWQMLSVDGLGRRPARRHLPDTVCQMPSLPNASGFYRIWLKFKVTVSGRRRLLDGLGRQCLADGLPDAASARRRLLDAASARHRLPNA